VALTPIPAGGTERVRLPLTPGTWDLSVRYVSPRPIAVRAPGLRVTLPAAMERPGAAWPAGTVTVARRGTLPVTFTAERPLLSPGTVPVIGLATVLAARRAPARLVPLAKACGRWVDWYRASP